MQDLKYLTRKKRSSVFSLFGIRRHNRALKPQAAAVSRTIPPVTGTHRQKLKYGLVFIAIVLALTPISYLLVKGAPRVLHGVTDWVAARAARTPVAAEAAKPPTAGSFETACALLDGATSADGRLVARTNDGRTLHYTINDRLQKRVHGLLAEKQVPYGVFVALEPASGRILAMTSYSAADPAWTQSAFFDLYPMASLFKIVTATAALEARKITPDTVIEFRGKFTSENPRYWDASPRGKNNRLDVTYAMGKSINPVYGRLASEVAGKASMMESVRKFGFNQSLLPGIPVKESKAGEPQDQRSLMLMGAGLDHEVKISPLHAAVIMAALANDGKMMTPLLTERIADSTGGAAEELQPKEIRQLVSPEIASSLTRMLSSTVTSGTSRRAFHDRRGRPVLGNIDVAAKTGSINGDDPRGHYSWFAAFAPVKNPRIALVALVINQDKWKIKASQVGEQALSEFFDR